MKKPLKAVVISLSLLSGSLHGFQDQQSDAEQRAWELYLHKIRAAVNDNDRSVLRSLMAPDIFVSGGVGDDNKDGDSRDEALDFLDTSEIGAWHELRNLLAQDTVPAASWLKRRGSEGCPQRVSPPSANQEGNLKNGEWIAVFEYREGLNWYLTTFTECCD